jgi:hypothetical protein
VRQRKSVPGEPTPYRETPSHDKRQTSSPSSSGTRIAAKEMTSQSVLSELYRVQVLLARLVLLIDRRGEHEPEKSNPIWRLLSVWSRFG